MANARDNLTDGERFRRQALAYRYWLTWAAPASAGLNRHWFRDPADRDAFAFIFRQLPADIEVGEE